MRRRKILAGLGSLASTAALAGCTGGNSSDGTETNETSESPDRSYEVDEEAPARLQLLSVSTPDEITYGDEFEAEVAFANTGGATIADNRSISLHLLESGDVSAETIEVNSSDLESGERRSHVIGPFTADYAGKWEFKPGEKFDSTHDEFDGGFTVASKNASVGDSVTVKKDVRLAVDTVQYEQGVFYPTYESPGLGTNERTALQSTLEDYVLAVVRVTVENAGTEATDLSPKSFGIEDADMFTDVRGAELSETSIEGTALFDATVNPGSSVEGWMLFNVPTDALGDLALDINKDAAHAPAEIQVGLGDEPDLPAFELESADVPSERKEGYQEFAFDVTNTGETAGTFRGVVQWTWDDSDEWYHLEDTIEAEIPAGETRTVTHGSGWDGDQDTTYRFQPFGYEWEISV